MLKKVFVFKQDPYRSRDGRANYLNKPDTIYARPWFSNLAVLAFVFVDLFCLKVVWNLVQTEDPLANVKHFFILLGKMFFTPYGKEFFAYPGKQIFTS